MDFDTLTSRHNTNNSVNIPLAWAMFGGSTFLLFLLCYFCQKKLQDESMTMSQPVAPGQIYVVPTPVSQPQPSLNPTPSPPPAYRSVVKKDQCFLKPQNEPPPSYEMAIASMDANECKTKDSSTTSR